MKETKVKKNALTMLVVCSLVTITLIIAIVYFMSDNNKILSTRAQETQLESNGINNVYILDMSAYAISDNTIDSSIASYRTEYGIDDQIKIVVKLSEDVKNISNVKLCVKFGDDGPIREVTNLKFYTPNDDVGQYGYFEGLYTLQKGDNGELNITHFTADIELDNGMKDTLVLPQIINKNNIVADTTPLVINNTVTPTGYLKAGTKITSTITFSENAYILLYDSEQNVITPLNKLSKDPSLNDIRVYFSNNGKIKDSELGVNNDTKKVEVIDSKTLRITYTVGDGDNGKMYIFLDEICDIAGNYYAEDLPSSLINIADVTIDTIKPQIEEIRIAKNDNFKYYKKESQKFVETKGVVYKRTGNENQDWTNNDVYTYANEQDKIKIFIKFNEKVQVGASTGLGLKLGKDVKNIESSTSEPSNEMSYYYTINKEEWNGEEELKLILGNSAVDLAGNEIDLEGVEGWLKAQPDKDGVAQLPIDELDTPIVVDTVAPTIKAFRDLYQYAGTPKYTNGSKYYYSQNTRISFIVDWSEYIYSEGNPTMPLKVNIDNILFTTLYNPTTTDHKIFTYTTSNKFSKNGLLSVLQDSNIVTDLAGNSNIGNSRTTYKDYIDNVKPTIKVEELNRDNDSVTYKFTLSDGTEEYQSGVKANSLTNINNIVVTNGDIMEYTSINGNINTIKVLPSMDGKQRVYVKAGAFTDNVDNLSLASNVCTVNIDTTPPEVVFAESGNSYDYLGETVKIGTTVTAFDNAGIGKIEYVWSQDNKTVPTQNWLETSNSKFISKDVNTEGVWYLWIKVTDIVGNPHTVVSGEFEVIADKVPPVILLAESEGQYEITDVETTTTIGTTIAVEDNKSVKEIKYAWSNDNQTAPTDWSNVENSKYVSKEVSEESIWYLWVEATDVAGNVSKNVSGAFQVIYRDVTKPEMAVNVEKGVYYVGSAGLEIEIQLYVKDENLSKVKFAWAREEVEVGLFKEMELDGEKEKLLFVKRTLSKEDIGSWNLWVEAIDTFGNTRISKFGSYTVLDAVESIKLNTEDNTCIEDVVIKNEMRYLVVSENTTPELLKEYIETKEEIIFVDEEVGDEIANDQAFKTNDIIMVPSIGDAEPQYIIVVKGDINADAKIDMGDIIKLNKYRNRLIDMLDAEKIAGDIIKDGKTSLNDVLRLNKYRLGKIAYL